MTKGGGEGGQKYQKNEWHNMWKPPNSNVLIGIYSHKKRFLKMYGRCGSQQI